MIKTTKKDFNEFIEHCHNWQEKFGLDHWRIDFSHTKLDGAYAATILSDKYAVRIKLSTEWDIKATSEQLERCAKHEMIHVLLGRITHYAGQRYITKEMYASAAEEAVNQIERYIDGRTTGVIA